MSPEEMVRKLVDEYGGDEAVLKTLNPEQLAEIIRMYTAGEAAEGEPEQTPAAEEPPPEGAPMAEEEEEPAEHAEEETPAEEHDDAPAEEPAAAMDSYDDEPPADREPKKMSAWAKRMADKDCGKMSGTGAAPMAPKKVTTTQHFAETVKAVTAAVLKKLKPVEDRVAKLDKMSEERVAAETRATIEAEKKVLINSGIVTPAQIDAGMLDYLYDLPTDRVVKFSDGGKQKNGTPLQAALAKLKGGPVIMKFGEIVRGDPKRKPGANDEKTLKIEHQAERVRQTFEAFSEKFPKGTTAESLVAGFKNNAKSQPGLMAEEFLEGFPIQG